MKIKRSIIVAASLVIGLTTAGCNSVPSQEEGAKNSTKDEGVLVGAGAGGVIAGVGTYLFTGDADKAMKAAAAGAVVGATAGYFVGREIYKEQSNFANTEKFLEHHIKLARANNKNMVSANEEFALQIAQFNKEIDLLNVDYEKGAATRRDLYAQREKVEKQLDIQQKNNQQLLQRVQNQNKAISEAETKQAKLVNQEMIKLAELREENKRFKQAVAKHSQLVNELQTISTSDSLEG